MEGYMNPPAVDYGFGGFGGQGYPPNPPGVPGPTGMHNPAIYPPSNPPTGYPPAPPPPDNYGYNPYEFGTGYGSSRGGGPMRGGPSRGQMGRGAPPYMSDRGRGAARGFPDAGRGGYGRGRSIPPRNKVGENYGDGQEWGVGRNEMSSPQSGTILIQNLPGHVTEQDLCHHFGSAGAIKTDVRSGLPAVWLGPQPGEARVTFQDPQVAQSAIQWYNNSDFQGNQIAVVQPPASTPPAPLPMSLTSQDGMRGRGMPRGGPPSRGGRFSSPRGGAPRGGPRGAPAGGKGDAGSFKTRDGDWTCANPSCRNTNFSWRSECNRCKAQRQDDDEEFTPGMNGDNSNGGRGGMGPSRGMRGMPFGGGRDGAPRSGRFSMSGPRGGGRGSSRGGMSGPRGGMSGPPRGGMGRGGSMGGRGGGGPMRGRGGMSDRDGGFRGSARGGFNPRRGGMPQHGEGSRGRGGRPY